MNKRGTVSMAEVLVQAKMKNRSREDILPHSHLLQHKLPDVVSQLVLVQMRAPCVIREVIRNKVVHSLFQVQVSWLKENKKRKETTMTTVQTLLLVIVTDRAGQLLVSVNIK